MGKSLTKNDKKEKLKDMIRQLHDGAKPEELKEKFKDVLKSTDSAEIGMIEEELIREGMPREEIHRLCDLHLTIFKESLDREKVLAPPGHPINTLMEEHKMLLQFVEMLKKVGGELKKAESQPAIDEQMKFLDHLVSHFKESEKHYLREENVLFPYLEKHGITGPPAVMWAEHDEIRSIKKRLYQILETRENVQTQELANGVQEVAMSLGDKLSNHFFKENNVLFPMSIKTISEEEWKDIGHQFDDIGYCCFTPEYARKAAEEKVAPSREVPVTAEGAIAFETGAFSRDNLELVLNALPVDITFVDKDDTVRYFSQSKDRIFVRTKAIIGRKVQACHPQKSIHRVQQILDKFREGTRDNADFWINLNDRLILIRYFAVRDGNGEYVGCLEVTQDITDIKKIEGEKRLL